MEMILMDIYLINAQHINDKTLELHQMYLAYWLRHIVFSWQWFLGVALLLIPILVWFLLRDRKSVDRLQYGGLFVALISAYLDYFGLFFGFWRYDYPVIPFTDNYFPSSLTSLPVTVMLLLQYRPVRNPFLNAFLYVVL